MSELKEFDLRTTIRDQKTGKVVKEQPWKGYFKKSGQHVFERDGKFYYQNGQEAPRPEGAPDCQASPVKED